MAKRKRAKKKRPAKRKARKKKPAKRLRDARGHFVKAKRPKKKPAKKPPQSLGSGPGPRPGAQPQTTGEAAEDAAIERIQAKAEAEGLASLSSREAKRLERYEKGLHAEMRAQALRACTQTELGALLQTSVKVFGDWKAEGMPHTNRGREVFYDLFQVFPWLKERWIEQSKNKGASPAEAEWDLRFKVARTLRAEREEHASEGRLLVRETVEEEAAACVRTLRARLEVLGSRVAPLCEGLEARGIAAVVDREVRVFLEDLARGMAALAPPAGTR